MALYARNNPLMDIAAIIASNLSAWMQANPALDTLQKLENRSGVGFGTVRRAKNGDANLTVAKLAAIAAAFGRTPADLVTPRSETGRDTDHAAGRAITFVEFHRSRFRGRVSSPIQLDPLALPPRRRGRLWRPHGNGQGLGAGPHRIGDRGSNATIWHGGRETAGVTRPRAKVYKFPAQRNTT